MSSMPVYASRTADPAAVPPVAVALLAGGLVGVLTSFGQSCELLGGTLRPLVNSVSAWVLLAFLLPGALRLRPTRGAVVGTVLCLAEVAGYYLTAHARGFAAGNAAYVWALCAVCAGPVFGFLGAARVASRHPARALAEAAPPAMLLAEAVGVYALRLGEAGPAILLGVGAVGLAAWLVRQRSSLLWLVALTLGLGAVLVLANQALTVAGAA